MGHVLKDFITGSALVISGVFLSIIALLALFILGLIFHVIGILASALFFLLLVFFSIWVVGFTYRKIKELRRK